MFNSMASSLVRRQMMLAQHRVKQVIKPLFLPDERRLREVRYGPARGVRLLLNRRTDLQREFGLYEHELSRFYRATVRPQSVVYDVGAADGGTTLMFASLASRGHVFAFEPESAAAQAFERNIAANPQLAPRISKGARLFSRCGRFLQASLKFLDQAPARQLLLADLALGSCTHNAPTLCTTAARVQVKFLSPLKPSNPRQQ